MVVSHEASRTGAPRTVIDILRGLEGLDAERMLVHRWGGPLASQMDAAADRHLHEPLRRVRAQLRNHRRTRRLAVPVETFAASLVLRRFRPELVWCNTSLSACYVRPAQRAGIPVVLHVHELGELAGPVLDRYGLTGVGSGGLRGVTVVACSDACAQSTAALLGVDSDAVTVLHSAVDTAVLIPPAAVPGVHKSGPIEVVACGLANHGKGVDLFLEAARITRRAQGDRIRFTWVGKFDRDPREPQDTNVRFVGEQADATAWIGGADIFVLPSRADAFPLVVLEAMALGRPVVAFDVGGVRQQLGDTGVLVPPGDPAGLSSAIRQLSGDEARRVEMGSAGRQRVCDNWDIRAFWNQVNHLAQPGCLLARR